MRDCPASVMKTLYGDIKEALQRKFYEVKLDQNREFKMARNDLFRDKIKSANHDYHSLQIFSFSSSFLFSQGFGGSSQGFANFLLFCVFTEQFKTRLRGVAQKLFVCCLLPIKRKLQDSSGYSGEETPMIETRSLADSCHNKYETYD